MYHPLTPFRLLDTRDGTGGTWSAFASHVARTFPVGGNGVVPAGAVAVTGNLTVTAADHLGYLFIGPVAMNNPTSSNLNFPMNDDRANAVAVALGPSGAGGHIRRSHPGPWADVIFDVTGYFAPAAQ